MLKLIFKWFACTSFFLVIAASVQARDAKVFWFSDPVNPGQTVQVSGMGLQAVTSLDVSRLGDRADAPAVSTAVPLPADIVLKADSTLDFVLPKDLAPGVFSVTLHTTDEELTLQLNCPDVYWVQGDSGNTATPGGWIRVSGRNIALNEHAIALLVGADGKETKLKVGDPDTWSATYPIPESLAVGTYRLRLWNGTGDLSAWRNAGALIVALRQKAQQNFLELSANANTGPERDDTARINLAMQRLGNQGGGNLLLHYGQYRLSGTLVIPNGVHLRGDSSELVTLSWIDFDNPPDDLIEGVKDFSVEDLTILTGRHFNILRGGVDPLSGKSTGSNIAVKRVVMRGLSFLGHLRGDQPQQRLIPMLNHSRDGVVGLLLGGANLVVEDCDILSSMRPFVLIQPTGARLFGNTFRSGRLGWYSISGPNGVLFENNLITGADLQATGGGLNTLGGDSAARNVLLRNNKFDSLFGWDREAMTSDGPGGYYSGGVKSIGGAVLKIDAAGLGKLQSRDWRNAALFILQGRGLGLMARVQERVGDQIALDTDMSAVIDDSSVITIVPLQENYLIIGNKFTDVGSAQIFGTGYKHVFYGNVALRSDGFVATSLDYDHPQPNFYIQFIGNRVTSPLFRGLGVNVAGRQFEGNSTLLTFGIVVRENKLVGATLRINGGSTTSPAINNVLVEQNEISYGSVGIDIGPGVEGLLMRNNYIHDVITPLRRAVFK